MIALDTNVIVRVLAADDPEQLDVAKNLIANNRISLCKTVILETEWVLRFSYELSPHTIHDAFRRLFGLENLHVEDRAAVLTALAWYADGMDFADALHLASSSAGGQVERFATFDRSLAAAAARLEATPVVERLG